MENRDKMSGQGTHEKNTATGKETQDFVGENPAKDPGDWVTGEEPMTGSQRSYLHTLAREAGEEIDENMSKADASRKIEALQEETGRGKQTS